MPSGYIPNDPTTWTDFRNPSAHGFVKVNRHTPLETVFRDGAIVLAVGAAVCGWLIYGEHAALFAGMARPWLWPAGLLTAGAAMFLARALTDNFYLIDPSRHVVYYHFKLAFVRRVTSMLSRPDILVACAETRKNRNKYSSWWEHRAALVRTDGRVVPMADWQRDGLWEANNAARDLAGHLGCEWRETPDQHRLVVRAKDGRAAVTFEAFTWMTSLDPYRVTLALIAMFVGLSMATGWLRFP